MASPSSSPAPAPAVPLVPTVYWSQSSASLSLKLDIKDCRAETLKIKVSGASSASLMIQAESRAEGRKYELHLDLYDGVMPLPKPLVTSSSVLVSFAKTAECPSSWPRLLSDPNAAKQHKDRIKVDWERWVDEDEEVDAAAEERNAAEKRELSQAWANQAAKIQGIPPPHPPMQPQSQGLGAFQVSTSPALAAMPLATRAKLTYLLAYNLMILGCLAVILFTIGQQLWVNYFPRKAWTPPALAPGGAAGAGAGAGAAAGEGLSVAGFGPAAAVGLALEAHSGGLFNALYYGLSLAHARVGWVVYLCQSLASLEVLHAAVGLIAGRVLPSLLLNGGRNIVLFGLIWAFPSCQVDWSVGALYLLWALGDSLRFVYYLMALVGSSAEAQAVADSFLGTVVLQALLHKPSVELVKAARYTVPLILLPFGFAAELKVLWECLTPASAVDVVAGVGLDSILKVYALLAYILGAPFLYMAVLAQRKSKLGGGKKKVASASAKASSSDSKKAQ